MKLKHLTPIKLAEQGLLPDWLIRLAIRRLCKERLLNEHINDAELQQTRFQALIEELRLSPIAIETDTANEQHYEVPTEFYLNSLGKHLKYSCCYYPQGCNNLDEAEATMLALYGQRAELKNGQHVLELGCGWGSLTLWMAEHYPKSNITAVSNSSTQKAYIDGECKKRGFKNVTVMTQDVNKLKLKQTFDRVISIEMFEHMRNYRKLMQNIAGWLNKNGKLFVHIFCHRTVSYPFEVDGDSDWMSKYYFTGGLMPSADTLLHFQEYLSLQNRWLVDGTHYEKTCNHWLEKMDAKLDIIKPHFASCYGNQNVTTWINRWRIFYMACAELFGLNNGQDWMVAHYLFKKK